MTASSWLAMPNSGQRLVDAAQGIDARPDRGSSPRPRPGGGAEDVEPGMSVSGRAAYRTGREGLEQEAAHARAGVDGGQDEQGLEHDGEVVPEADEALAAADVGEDLAMPRARVGAPPVRSNRVGFADARGQGGHWPAVTGKPQPVMVATAASAVAPTSRPGS